MKQGRITFFWDFKDVHYGIVYQHKVGQWILPHELAKHIKYNPRQLPVPVPPRDELLYQSILRTLRGYRAI